MFKLIKTLNLLLFLIIFSAAIVASVIFVWAEKENGDLVTLLEKSFGSKVASQIAAKANINSTQVGSKSSSQEGNQPESEEKEPTRWERILAYILPFKNSENQAAQTSVSITKKNQPQAEFSFVAIGDSESYNDSTGYNPEWLDVMDKASSLNPDFAVFTGDIITATGSRTKIRDRISDVKAHIQRRFLKYYITFGNHDVECGIDCVDLWEEVFFERLYQPNEERKLYFSFDYQNTHFVLLSTVFPQEKSIDDVQLSWLDQDLANTDKPNKIVISHVSPVNFFEKAAKRCHDMSCNKEQRDKLMAILRKHKVDLVISGHENSFDHKIVDNIDFVLSGDSGNKKKTKKI